MHKRIFAALLSLLAAPALLRGAALVGTGTYSLTRPETDIHLIYAGGAQLLASSLPAGVSTGTSTFDVPDGINSARLCVAGLYAGGLSMVLDSAFATPALLSEASIETLFGGLRSEPQLIADLTAGNFAFFQTFLFVFPNAFPLVQANGVPVTATIVNFSSATFGGTATLAVSPVPEPSSTLLLLAGGLLIARRNFNRKGG